MFVNKIYGRITKGIHKFETWNFQGFYFSLKGTCERIRFLTLNTGCNSNVHKHWKRVIFFFDFLTKGIGLKIKRNWTKSVVSLTLKSFRKQFQSTTHSVNAGKLLRLSTYHCKLFLFSFKCFEVGIAIWMDTTTNIFLRISRFTTIMSQCRGGPWHQV